MLIYARAAMIALTAALGACSNPTAWLDVATTPAEDRSFTDVTEDARIKLAISDRLLSSQYRDLFFDVSSIVYQGRVLLTGKVKSEQDKARATELARSIGGVKEVFNEIIVAGDNLANAANDTFIEAEIKARLLGTRDVKSIDYRWTAVNGTVYLIGLARSNAEARRAVEVIRNTKYVKQVVAHVWTQP
jgi:osmotically-inducible protein OsmY